MRRWTHPLLPLTAVAGTVLRCSLVNVIFKGKDKDKKERKTKTKIKHTTSTDCCGRDCAKVLTSQCHIFKDNTKRETQTQTKTKTKQ